MTLKSFPKVASDTDLWNGFAENINFIGQVAENLKKNLKFQCRNPASDVDFEKFFKVNFRPVEQLIIDVSFAVRVPNDDAVSNRLLKDFFGLDEYCK